MPSPALPTDWPTETRWRRLRPLYALRPWLFALGFLALCELLLRGLLPPDRRAVETGGAEMCMAEDKLATLLALRQPSAEGAPKPAALDVVLLGDSVLLSQSSAPGERLGDRLQIAVQAKNPGRVVRVHNLSQPGARAADLLGATRRLAARLGETPMGVDNLVLVLDVNPLFFSRRNQQPPALFPCLFDEAARGDPLLARLLPALQLPTLPSKLELRTRQVLAKHLYLFQQQQVVTKWLFGGPPREHLRDHLLQLHRGKGGTFAQRNVPWHERALRAEQYASSYEFVPLDAEDATNFQAVQVLGTLLQQQGRLKTLVMQPAHNHDFLRALTSQPGYQAVSAAIAKALGSSTRFVSYDHHPALLSDHFVDLDHLNAEGNRTLAGLLAEDLQPLLGSETLGSAETGTAIDG